MLTPLKYYRRPTVIIFYAEMHFILLEFADVDYSRSTMPVSLLKLTRNVFAVYATRHVQNKSGV